MFSFFLGEMCGALSNGPGSPSINLDERRQASEKFCRGIEFSQNMIFDQEYSTIMEAKTFSMTEWVCRQVYVLPYHISKRYARPIGE
jgi:hypothetical protein